MKHIFEGKVLVIPLANVSHVEKYWYQGDERTLENIKGLIVVMASSTWNGELDCYNNAPFVHADEVDTFQKAWKEYLAELDNPEKSSAPAHFELKIEPSTGPSFPPSGSYRFQNRTTLSWTVVLAGDSNFASGISFAEEVSDGERWMPIKTHGGCGA